MYLPMWNTVESDHLTVIFSSLKSQFHPKFCLDFLSADNLTLSTLDQLEVWGEWGLSWTAKAVFYQLCFNYSTIKYMLTLPPYNLENVKN